MRKKLGFIFLIIVGCFQLTAQQKLSEKVTVSVVTSGAGNELYTAFGHSAFRVYDPLIGLDKIYNYGTFDFNTPNFYFNFAKGKLIYQLSTTQFSYFLRMNQYENRWVKLQELNLTQYEAQAVFDFLENNAKPENKSYQYDFFYDNCATKIEDVIKTVLKEKVTFTNNHISTKKSHRDLIADYTKNFKWGKFGIDLALGSVIDDDATKDDYKFLPDYIFQAFNNATILSSTNTKPLVKKSKTILKNKPFKKSKSISDPFYVFLVLSIFILTITYRNYRNKSRTKWLDFSLYFISGFIGVAVLLLWFATTHTATYKNFNFLWAFAPNLVTSFYLLNTKLPKWLGYYNWFLLLLLLSMLILWLVKIQVFSLAISPLIITLGVRYLFLIYFRNKFIT